MQMQNGSAGFRRLDRLARNVFRRERKVRRHGRGMDRPRDGAADDDLVIHERSFSGLSANYTVSSGWMKHRTVLLLHKDDPVSIRILDGQHGPQPLDR